MKLAPQVRSLDAVVFSSLHAEFTGEGINPCAFPPTMDE